MLPASGCGRCPPRHGASHGNRGWGCPHHSFPRLARTPWSWLRELMASLRKTLCKWYSTVRGLMNSRAAISGLDSPSPASRPIWISRAVSWTGASVMRLRARSPVASSSRLVRSAKPSTPIVTNISCAIRSCSRASTRRFWRRSHSPYRRWARASSTRRRVRPRRSTASRYRRSAVWPSLSSARAHASTPSAQSVPLARALSDSLSRALAARSGIPLRTAASISSAAAHVENTSSCGSSPARCAAASAS
jgi:hypothetical protein